MCRELTENTPLVHDDIQRMSRGAPVIQLLPVGTTHPTTFDEGRFLEVNAAFEGRYGHSRRELLGRTVYELRIWDDPSDRRILIEQLRRGRPIRNVITRLRTKSGEVKLTAYSADRIQFEGQTCILALSQDVVTRDPKSTN